MLADKEIILAGSNYSFKKILYYAAYYFIAAVLFVSGVSKIIDPQPLLDTLSLIKFLPDELRIAIATALPMVELTLAIILIGKIKVKLALLLTTILFFSFLTFSVYGTIAGMEADCGCFGSTIKSDISWRMVGRNLLFLILNILIIKKNFKSKLQS